VYAYDRHGVRSNISNIVSARLVTTILTETDPDGRIIPGLDNLWFYIIMAVGSALLVALLFICVCCCVVGQRKKRSKRSDPEWKFSHARQTGTLKSTISLDFTSGELANHDTIASPDQIYSTYGKKKLVSTKKAGSLKQPAISLERVTNSLKRSQKKDEKKKGDAPDPPTAVKANGVAQQADKLNGADNNGYHGETTTANSKSNGATKGKKQLPKVLNFSELEQDLQFGDMLANQAVRDESTPAPADVVF